MTEGVNNNTNTKANIAMYAAMPAMTLTLSAGHGIKGARGISKAIKYQNHEGFKNLNALLRNEGCDVFTRSAKIADEYEKHKNIIKNFNKWNNKKNALKNGKLGKWDSFTNFFRNKDKKLTTETVEAQAKRAGELKNAADAALNNATTGKEALSAMDDALKSANKAVETVEDGAKAVNGTKETVKNVEKAADAIDEAADITQTAAKGAKAVENGLKGSVGKLFRTELTSKFNIAMTALSFIPNVIERVVPAFKEQGFGAGIKETGKVLVQAGTDLVSYAFGGALGRTVGTVIGTVIFPGVGTAIGAMLGDTAGSILIGGKITKAVDKVIGADEETEEKLKEERTAKQAAQEALAYNPDTVQPKFDAQF